MGTGDFFSPVHIYPGHRKHKRVQSQKTTVGLLLSLPLVQIKPGTSWTLIFFFFFPMVDYANNTNHSNKKPHTCHATHTVFRSPLITATSISWQISLALSVKFPFISQMLMDNKVKQIKSSVYEMSVKDLEKWT